MQAAALICTWSAILFLPVYVFFGLSRPLSDLSGPVHEQSCGHGVQSRDCAARSLAATAIIALLPVVASLLAILVLGQVPLPAQWVAIIVVGMGVGLAAKHPSIRSALLKRPTQGE